MRLLLLLVVNLKNICFILSYLWLWKITGLTYSIFYFKNNGIIYSRLQLFYLLLSHKYICHDYKSNQVTCLLLIEEKDFAYRIVELY